MTEIFDSIQYSPSKTFKELFKIALVVETKKVDTQKPPNNFRRFLTFVGLSNKELK